MYIRTSVLYSLENDIFFMLDFSGFSDIIYIL